LLSLRNKLFGILRGPYLRKGLIFVLSCAGLAWGLQVFPVSEKIDEFRSLRSQLLRSETFSQQALATELSISNSQVPNECDSDAQVALLLIEMRLAEASLRAGDVTQFDQHARSLQLRVKRTLSCAPRQSFVWLIAFSLAVLHGQLDSDSIGMLTLSYKTSPDEAWIAIRRNFVAVPIVQLLPEALSQKVLSEFQQLIRDGFEAEASRSFLRATGPVRSLLQARVERLDEPRQEAFWKASQKVGS
jgi:hypothetical protein